MKKNFFSRVSVKIGFTELELKVLFFVSILFFVGILSKYFIFEEPAAVKKKFDYYRIDSLVSIEKSGLKPELNIDNSEKKVEYEQELSDFSTNDKKANYKSFTAANNNPLNINIAGFKDLIRLPGIGEKTAKSIIEYRRINGGFNNIKELMNVKGIGKRKFDKIKSLIICEK